MIKFKIIHIFKDEVQIIGNQNPKKVKSENLTKLQDFIDSLIELKPTEVDLNEYHSIVVFYEIKARYIDKKANSFFNKNWIVTWDNINKELLSDLIEEIESI